MRMMEFKRQNEKSVSCQTVRHRLFHQSAINKFTNPKIDLFRCDLLIFNNPTGKFINLRIRIKHDQS